MVPARTLAGRSDFMILFKTPLAIVGFPVLVFVVHGVALVTGIYEAINFFDSLMHVAGGLVAALSFYGMLGMAEDRRLLTIDDVRVLRLLLVGLVALVTIAWEVFEFLLDAYVGTSWQLSIADTLKDQLLGVLGAVVVVLRIR